MLGGSITFTCFIYTFILVPFYKGVLILLNCKRNFMKCQYHREKKSCSRISETPTHFSSMSYQGNINKKKKKQVILGLVLDNKL